MNRPIISLTLRFVLGLNFLFAAIAHLNLWRFYTEDPKKITSWITGNAVLGNVIAAGFLLAAPFLLLGYKTVWAILSGMALLLINHAALLFTSPGVGSFSGAFYNSFHHSVPFLGFSMILLHSLSAKNDFSVDRFSAKKSDNLTEETKNELVFMTARIFVGLIFLAQGLSILTGKSGSLGFAETVYVKPYATTFIPTVLLWLMGVVNPWILAGGGAFLVLGLKTRWIAWLLAFFMVSIAFGHLLSDPYETTGDISMYGFNNLAVVMLVLWLENGANKYTVDGLFLTKTST